MEMEGSRQLAVTQQQAWDALNDPEVLKACIPGCDSIEVTGENEFAVTNKLKIGPVSAKFNSTIELSDIEAPHSYTLNFEGKGGPAGFGKGTARVALTPNDEGTELAYQVDASVGGKIAQVGQRLIDGVAKSMAEKFFKQFDEEMQRRHPAADAGDPGEASVPQTPAPAGASAGGVPGWIWIGLAVIVVLGVVVAVRM